MLLLEFACDFVIISAHVTNYYGKRKRKQKVDAFSYVGSSSHSTLLFEFVHVFLIVTVVFFYHLLDIDIYECHSKYAWMFVILLMLF